MSLFPRRQSLNFLVRKTACWRHGIWEMWIRIYALNKSKRICAKLSKYNEILTQKKYKTELYQIDFYRTLEFKIQISLRVYTLLCFDLVSAYITKRKPNIPGRLGCEIHNLFVQIFLVMVQILFHFFVVFFRKYVIIVQKFLILSLHGIQMNSSKIIRYFLIFIKFSLVKILQNFALFGSSLFRNYAIISYILENMSRK